MIERAFGVERLEICSYGISDVCIDLIFTRGMYLVSSLCT